MSAPQDATGAGSHIGDTDAVPTFESTIEALVGQ
jgi:hypothetical protein